MWEQCTPLLALHLMSYTSVHVSRVFPYISVCIRFLAGIHLRVRIRNVYTRANLNKSAVWDPTCCVYLTWALQIQLSCLVAFYLTYRCGQETRTGATGKEWVRGIWTLEKRDSWLSVLWMNKLLLQLQVIKINIRKRLATAASKWRWTAYHKSGD